MKWSVQVTCYSSPENLIYFLHSKNAISATEIKKVRKNILENEKQKEMGAKRKIPKKSYYWSA